LAFHPAGDVVAVGSNAPAVHLCAVPSLAVASTFHKPHKYALHPLGPHTFAWLPCSGPHTSFPIAFPPLVCPPCFVSQTSLPPSPPSHLAGAPSTASHGPSTAPSWQAAPTTRVYGYIGAFPHRGSHCSYQGSLSSVAELFPRVGTVRDVAFLEASLVAACGGENFVSLIDTTSGSLTSLSVLLSLIFSPFFHPLLPRRPH